MKSLFFLFITSACITHASNAAIPAPILADYSGIWQSVKNNGDVFYFYIENRTCYVIGDNWEEYRTCWTKGDHFFSQTATYDAPILETITTYFDGQKWLYRSPNGVETYKARHIYEPLKEIKGYRFSVAMFAMQQGAKEWYHYDKDGNQLQQVTATAYFRLVKEARYNGPAYNKFGGGVGFSGVFTDIYFYIEDYYNTGEKQFDGYFHFYIYGAYMSKGTVRSWNLSFEGPCRWYYKSGQLMQEGHYTEGVLYGSYKVYTENGQLKKTEQGKPLSTYNYYVEDKILGSRR